jgi:hypothetical protein
LDGQQLGVEPSPLDRSLALELADVPLDPRQARRQRRQCQRQLGVVIGVRTELGDAVGQQVALGDDGGVACGGRGSHSPGGHRGADGGTDQQAQQHRQQHVHASDGCSPHRQCADEHA